MKIGSFETIPLWRMCEESLKMSFDHVLPQWMIFQLILISSSFREFIDTHWAEFNFVLLLKLHLQSLLFLHIQFLSRGFKLRMEVCWILKIYFYVEVWEVSYLSIENGAPCEVHVQLHIKAGQYELNLRIQENLGQETSLEKEF